MFAAVERAVIAFSRLRDCCPPSGIKPASPSAKQQQFRLCDSACYLLTTASTANSVHEQLSCFDGQTSKTTIKRQRRSATSPIFGRRSVCHAASGFDPVKLAAAASPGIRRSSPALQEQNVEVPSGQLGAPPSDKTSSPSRLRQCRRTPHHPPGVRRHRCQNTPNGIVQMKDVGYAELGSSSYAQHTSPSTASPPVGSASSSSAMPTPFQVDRGRKAELAQLSKSFPPGMSSPSHSTPLPSFGRLHP